MLEKFSLSGKVALVTGGRGLYGRQIVASLASAGARTYMGSRSLDKQLEIAGELRVNEGLEVTPLLLDQSDEASVFAVRDEILARSGAIDILVNNAVYRPMKKAYWDDPSAFAESMAVNATGLFVITRAIGDVMAQNGRGSIINIGSIQGMVGPDATLYKDTQMLGFYPDYFFHKGGMINYTRFLASLYGPRGVRCNCISPGGFWTDDMPDVFVQRYGERTFLGRLANSTDLQGAIVFLASDASEYVTGINLPVDGGYTAK